MENASKALLMAAGVLIGMLVISLAVYLFISFGSTSAEIHKQNEEQQIAQFNSQFVSYEEKSCTIYDVVTVANLATENNIYYEFPQREIDEFNRLKGKDNYIRVIIKDNNLSEYYRLEFGYNSNSNNIAQYYNTLISEVLKNMQIKEKKEESDLAKYKCKAEISKITNRVCNVEFSLIN